MYVFIKSEPRLWTVGFFQPDGKFYPIEDFSSPEEAGRHTAFLNGGPNPEERLLNEIRRLVNRAIMAKNGEWLGLENTDTIEGAIDRERAIGAAGALEAVFAALNGRPEKLAGMSS